jgi:hypothetical protein
MAGAWQRVSVPLLFLLYQFMRKKSGLRYCLSELLSGLLQRFLSVGRRRVPVKIAFKSIALEENGSGY